MALPIRMLVMICQKNKIERRAGRIRRRIPIPAMPRSVYPHFIPGNGKARAAMNLKAVAGALIKKNAQKPGKQ